MLPEERIAAPGRIEERQSEGALGLEQHGAQDQRRERYEHHQSRDQDVPAEDRHSVERHARRPHLEDGNNHFDGERERRYLDEGHTEQPDVGIDSGRVDVRAQRRVHEPATVGRDPGDQRGGEDCAAEQVAPVAVGGQPREREVSRAEHLGSEIDRDALQHWYGEEEKHHRPMHGEDLVVGLRVHECRLGRRELHASEHAEHAGDREEHESRRHESYAENRMVDRRKALPSRACGPDPFELAVKR